MSFTKKTRRGAVFAAVAIGLTLGTGALASAASAANVPLPAYPNTTTLNLGSPYCVTDDVIMNDPSTSLTVTAGSDGSPVVYSQDTEPIWYSMQYWNGNSPESSNTNWTSTPPPGVQIDKNTGVISAYGNGAPMITGDTVGPTAVSGIQTYTVRVIGTDSDHAAGVEQFQLNVNGTSSATTVSYAGNDSDNANADLTIGLNANGTQLNLNAGNLGNPDATPVTFTLIGGSGWHLTGEAPTGAVLTGDGVNDPEIQATTNDGDVAFFKLSGISTDSGGNFYENGDTNPCVGEPAAPVITPTQPVVSTGFGDFVNHFGNGFDVLGQHAWVNQPVVGWTAYAGDSDPAVHFVSNAEGSDFQLEYAPYGTGDGLCVSNPGNNVLVLRYCNGNIWQKFYTDGSGHVRSAVNNGYVNPDGKGAALTVGGAPTPWGGSVYQWVPNA